MIALSTAFLLSTLPPVALPREIVTPEARPITVSEIAPLQAGRPAASILLDLPRRGPVTLNLTAARLVDDAFRIEVATVIDGATRSRVMKPLLPHAYAGAVAGSPDSRVFIGLGTEAAEGLVAGFIELDGETWWLSSGNEVARRAGMPAMLAHESAFADAATHGMQCGADAIKQPFIESVSFDVAEGGIAGGVACREYRVAIDTDTEFTMTAHGGNTVAAAQYALLLMGASSQVYDRDVDIKLPVSYLRLWTGEDPWVQTEMGAQLGEYRDHWVANMGAVPREVGHYLAGRGLGGGVAWLGVACSVPQWAYALSSGVGYGFPYPLVDHDHGNWEPMVVSHELGHNFGAPHTHDHNPQADGCGTGDCSLADTGTIMSYCHGCPGGMSNISLNFHPFSIASMNAHLATTACGDSGAYAVDDAIATVENTPAGLDPLANDAFVNCAELSLLGYDEHSAEGGTIVLAPSQPGLPPYLEYAPPANFSGDDSFAYTAVDSSGNSSTAIVHVSVRPVLDRIYLEFPSDGVVANWYALPGDTALLPDFSTMTPYGSSILPQIAIASTSGAFSSSGRSDLVAAAFEGYIRIPTTGIWTLSTESDDGSRLWIDGVLVADNDGLHGMVERAGQIGLENGYHRIRLEFFENFGGAGEILRWQGPAVPREIVPSSAFARGGSEVMLDLDSDGVVGASDLAILLDAWGPVASGTPADFDRSGTVDAADLARILTNWGP
jgi:hypothetical protein